MISFKKFLLEGGAATKKLNTQRASADDIKNAFAFLTKHTDLTKQYLEDSLLGSCEDIYFKRPRKDNKKLAGDIDIAIDLSRFDKDKILSQVEAALKKEKYNPQVRQTGKSVFSYAVPGVGKLVQLDLMFVPSIKWAKWSYHSPSDSLYSGATRNILLMAVARSKLSPGEDIEVKNSDGETLVRVRRALKMDAGLERIFKIAPHRKDGKGRVKSLQTVSPEEAESELQKLGVQSRINKKADNNSNPDEVAERLFGRGVKAADLLTTEQVIDKISKLENAKEIFKDAVGDLERQKISIPPELEKYR